MTSSPATLTDLVDAAACADRTAPLDLESAVEEWRLARAGRRLVLRCAMVDARRLTLLVEPGVGRSLKPLDPCQCQLLLRLSSGQSQKQASMDLDLSHPTTSLLVKRAVSGLRATNRLQIVRHIGPWAALGESASTDRESDSFRVSRVVWAGAEVIVVGYSSIAGCVARGHLSAAERDVAWRAVQGESNLTIARGRGRSVRTVANQLANIYSKLKIGSRVELAVALSRDLHEQCA